MTWLTYAYISLFAFSIYEVLARLAGLGAKNPRVFSVVYNLLIGVYVVPLLWLEKPTWPDWNVQTIGLTLASVLVWSLFVRYEYSAHQQVEATLFAVLLKLAPVITFVLGTSLLGEIFSWQKVIGVALVVLANIALLWGGWERLHISRSGLRYSGLVVLSLGVGWTMDKVVAPWYGVALYTYVSCGLPALVNIWWSRIGWRDLSQELKTGGKWLALLPALAVIGYFALVKALVLGDVSSAVSVATATTPMVMLLGLVFLKETNQWKRKIVATLLTMMGVWLLST